MTPLGKPPADDFAEQRRHMVETQIAARGVRDAAVLAAMAKLPRERFVAEEHRAAAYADRSLAIGEGQTISQPYVVAAMIEHLALGPEDRVLEVGTGSGFAAAVLGCIAREVYTLERLASLAEAATRRLDALGFANVHVRHGDGTGGWPEHAPYAGILVSAAAAKIPPALREQLALGGRLVIPVGPTPGVQTLLRLTREGREDYRRDSFELVSFVPFIGAEG